MRRNCWDRFFRYFFMHENTCHHLFLVPHQQWQSIAYKKPILCYQNNMHSRTVWIKGNYLSQKICVDFATQRSMPVPSQSLEELWADLEVFGPKTKAFPAIVLMLCGGTLYTMVIQEPWTFSKQFYVFIPSGNWNNMTWFYFHFLTWFSLPKISCTTPFRSAWSANSCSPWRLS